MSQRHWKIIVCLFLVLATVAVYGEVRNHQFVSFDDTVYILENPRIQGGLTLTGLVWAFTTTYASNWHPLTWLSHMLDCGLYGLNPRGHHLTNLFFHLANVLLLFLVLESMTQARWPSALTAALFALHPLHVESVAWVAERKDVLSGFFWLATMGAYLWYTRRPGLARYLAVILSFALGLMAKPMLVTLPFVLLLLDYWPLGRFQWSPAPAASPGNGPKHTDLGFTLRLIWEKIPLLMLAALSCLITVYAQQLAIAPLKKVPFPTRLANALIAYVGYLGKMIWPLHLAVFYPYPKDGWPWWQVAAAALVLLGISVLALRGARKYPYFPVGWFWYLGTLVPVIGLVQVGGQAMADRYTYIPLIGIFIVLSWGIGDLTARWGHRRVLTPLAGTVLLVLMVFTWVQLGYWQNPRSLFEHAIKVTDNNAVAYSYLIEEYGKRREINKASDMFQKAIEIAPTYVYAYNNMGLAYEYNGRVSDAIPMYQKAIRVDPTFSEAYNSLGIIYASQGKNPEAIAMFQKAIQLNPSSAAYNNLGMALAKQGDLDQAIAMFEEAVKLNPQNVGAQEMLRTFKAQRGRQ
jgi:tetratricopeptide (TPR) repeat protein